MTSTIAMALVWVQFWAVAPAAAGAAGPKPGSPEDKILAETTAFLAADGKVDARVDGPEDTLIHHEGRFTRLHVAVARGHAKVALLLIERGADVSARSQPDGLTPLYYAAACGRLTVAKLLAARGAAVNARGEIGDTPLHAAAHEGHADLVTYLVAQGADIKARDALGHRPLYDALHNDRGPAAAALLDAGSDANEDGEVKLPKSASIPLGLAAWAITHDRTDVAGAMIVRCGKDIDKPVDGLTLLHYAARQNCPNIIRLLLSRRANPVSADAKGDTPLHYAARQGYTEAAKALLAGGANVNACCARGNTPLHLTIPDQMEMFTLLLASAADPNASNAHGQTPMHLAAEKNNLAMARALVKERAPVNVRDADGVTPLHWAAKNDAVRIASFLIGRGAKVSCPDKNGSTPLHNAACAGSLRVADLLILSGAEVDAKSKKGNTPLHWAVDNSEEVAKLLIAYGADIRVKDKTGMAMLHFAAGGGNPDMVKFLIEKKLDVKAVDLLGATPLHFAARNGQGPEVIKALVAAGADVNARTTQGETPLDQTHREHRETVATLQALGGAGTPKGDRPLRWNFYGSGGHAHNIVYVLDASENSQGWLGRSVAAVFKSIPRLQQSQYFQVLVHTGGHVRPIQGWAGKLAPATEENKRQAVTFLRTVKPAGPAAIIPVLKEALAVLATADPAHPGKLIYVLSDGRSRDRLKALTFMAKTQRDPKIGKPIYINTYLYGRQSPAVAKAFEKLAADNGGRFKRVLPKQTP